MWIRVIPSMWPPIVFGQRSDDPTNAVLHSGAPMSARTKRPNEMDKLVRKRDLVRLIAAFNEATRNLESRIEDLEKAQELGAMTPDELKQASEPLIQVVR